MGTTTKYSELRGMLVEAIEAIRSGRMSPAHGKSIAALAQAVNASLLVEINLRSAERKAKAGGAINLLEADVEIAHSVGDASTTAPALLVNKATAAEAMPTPSAVEASVGIQQAWVPPPMPPSPGRAAAGDVRRVVAGADGKARVVKGRQY